MGCSSFYDSGTGAAKFRVAGHLVLLGQKQLGSLVLSVLSCLAYLCDSLDSFLNSGVGVGELDSDLSIKFSPIAGVLRIAGVVYQLFEVVAPLVLVGALGNSLRVIPF